MKKQLLIIFLTVFIDLLGFGIIIPLLPAFSQEVLHINETTIGIVAGIFSLMQFLFTPIWGRLSDAYGRKPILLISLAGNTISYIMLGLVFGGVIRSVTALIVARAFAGLFSANIGAAMAYIADITKGKERSKAMGLIGTAFSLGFVFGPFLGGFLAKRFDYGFPVYVSAGLSLISLIFALLFLKESLSKELRTEFIFGKHFQLGSQISKMKEALRHPNVGLLIMLFFIMTFSFANIYATFQLYTAASTGFNFNIEQISYVFGYMGIMGALVQGGLLRILLKYFDERKILIAGNILMTIGLVTIPLSNHILFFLLTSVTILSLGNGLNQPIIISLISKFSNPDEQGGILGINQSLSALARFFGPTWGGFVYQFLGFQYPFFTGGLFMLLGSILSFKLLHDKYDYNIFKKNKDLNAS